MFNWLKSAILRGMVVVLPLGLTLWIEKDRRSRGPDDSPPTASATN